MATASPEKKTVRCPCGSKLKVPGDAIGKKVRCPKCQQTFIASAVDAAPPDSAPHHAGQDDGFSLLEDLAKAEKSAASLAPGAREFAGDRCPKCATALPKDAVLCVACGYNLKTGKSLGATKVAAAPGKAPARAKTASQFMLGCVLSFVGALIGAGVWAGIAIGTGYQIGWIAIGLGFLAGYGMALGYPGRDGKGGAAAACISIGGIFVAKVAVFVFLVSAVVTGNTNDIELQREFLAGSITDEMLDLEGVYDPQARRSKQPATYAKARARVAAMSDEQVRAAVKEQRDVNQLQADAMSGNSVADDMRRLAIHRATQKALRELQNQHAIGGLHYFRELVRVREMPPDERAAELKKLDEWEAGGKWDDEDYVRHALIRSLADRAGEERVHSPYRDPAQFWKGDIDTARAQVDGMEHAARAARLREIEHTQEIEMSRARLAGHRAGVRFTIELAAPGDPRRDTWVEEAEAEVGKLSDEELAAEVKKLDDWYEKGRFTDPKYVRAELIEAMATRAVVAKAVETKDFEKYDEYDCAPDVWQPLVDEATAKVDAIPADQHVARLQAIEDDPWAEVEYEEDPATSDAARAEMTRAAGELGGAFFSSMFGLLDLVFVFFAASTAYGVAVGGKN